MRVPLTASIAYGLVVFAGGFRLTEEVLPVIAALIAGGVFFGLILPRRPWLWGLGIGIGTRIADLLPSRPLSPEHIAQEGPSRPLPLPFGLTDHALAQWVAGSILIMAFPFMGAMIGGALRRVARFAGVIRSV